MKSVAEYRQYASECRQLAAKITHRKEKEEVEMMAGVWDKIANEREALLKTKKAQDVERDRVTCTRRAQAAAQSCSAIDPCVVTTQEKSRPVGDRL